MKKKNRLLYVTLTGFFFLSGVWLCLYFWLARPVGSGPAGPMVSAEPFEQVWSERKVLLLGLGDSITAGFGMEAPYGYVARLAHNPVDEFPDMQGKCLSRVLPNLSVLNIAVSGSTSIQHVDHIEEKLPMQPDDVYGLVVFTTGGNDLIHNYGRSKPREGAMYGATLEEAQPWIAAYEQRLDEMMLAIQAKFPGGCRIFLADIYDPTDGVGDAASAMLPSWPDGIKILERYNQAIRECAERNDFVEHVPIHAAFLGHGTHCTQFWRKNYRRDDPMYWFSSNLEDPSIRGFDAIRRVFLLKICKVQEEYSVFQ